MHTTTSVEIRIEEVTKTYRRGRVRALDRLSLVVPSGRVVGLIGPNGAGKTTLMGCALGLLRPDSGRVLIGGRAPDALAARAETGYLPERLVFDRWMRGEDFLAYQHALAGAPRGKCREAVGAALDRVEIARSEAMRPLRTYSRGMLQRIGLAQALIAKPRYLLLDEPTSGMDPTGLDVLRRALEDLKAEGAAVLLNSHQLDHVDRLCDTIYFVREGTIEDVTSSDPDARYSVRVRFVASVDVPQFEATLEEAAVAAGARLEHTDTRTACFEVRGDRGAADLAAELVRAGIGFSEFGPDGSRLERLFFERRRGLP